MQINELCRVANEIALEHGWWEELDNEDVPLHMHNYVYATKLALISSEVSEAIEDLRADDWEHLGEELADIAIRLADFAHQVDINLESEINRKMAININRPHKHGKMF